MKKSPISSNFLYVVDRSSYQMPGKKRIDRRKKAGRIRAGIRQDAKPANMSQQKWDDIQSLIASISQWQQMLDTMRHEAKTAFGADDLREALDWIMTVDDLQRELRALWKQIYGTFPRTHLVQMLVADESVDDTMAGKYKRAVLFKRYRDLLNDKERERIKRALSR